MSEIKSMLPQGWYVLREPTKEELVEISEYIKITYESLYKKNLREIVLVVLRQRDIISFEYPN